MTQWYESPCPACGDSVLCAAADLMGFPQMEFGDEDPLTATCDACGAVLSMTWTVTLHQEDVEEEEE